jgi:predicted RNA-binding Zn ribbon-like protein
MTVGPPPTIARHDRDFRFRSGLLCLNFVATIADRSHAAFDRWQNEDDFARWCVEAGLLSRRIEITGRQLAQARELRETIYGIVRAALGSKIPNQNAIRILNRHAMHPGLIPKLTRIGKLPEWDSSRPFEAVLSMVARNAIDLLSSNRLHRVRECADEHCSVLFVDLSRPGRRRWCAMNGCGNKEKKAAYRAKHRS